MCGHQVIANVQQTVFPVGYVVIVGGVFKDMLANVEDTIRNDDGA